MILKICAVILLVLTVLCVLIANMRSGDSDGDAMIQIFYFPAIAFGVIDGLLWLIVFLR